VKIVWSRRAIRHLAALREYVAENSPQNAAEVAARIVETVELLVTQPQIGRLGRIAGTRELIVPDTPYLLPYRIRSQRLEIIAVLHGRQKWPRKL
jgi:addiction module RelE/StbE family toxin